VSRDGTFDKRGGRFWRAMRHVGMCAWLPVALGIVGLMLVVGLGGGPGEVWRAKRCEFRGAWGPVKAVGWGVMVLLAVLLAPVFVVGFLVVSVVRSPHGLLKELKSMRERRRAWDRLREDGRVLTWEEAKRRVQSGEGMFVVEGNEPSWPLVDCGNARVD
jgi:hypothetical protein